MPRQNTNVRPQPGFQTAFMSTPADIAIGGGAAGSGKTFVELLEPLRHRKNPNFGAVIFRRTYPQITMQGGLWDESKNIYPNVGAIPTELQWDFLSGAKVTFRHMNSEKFLEEYQGAQIPLIEFDEMTHFTRRMFIYLLTRNRQGACQNVKPYIRGTCNPDPDSWLAEFIAWWIDQETGYPIPEHAGKVRYMVADQDQFVWGSSKEEVFEKAPHVFTSDAVVKTGIPKEQLVKSVTFIPGSIYENKKLLEKDPGYIANLLAQDEATQARLLHGNWKIRLDKRNLFTFYRLTDLFHNILPVQPSEEKYIVIDHAREGRDFCVIGTWQGWRCVRMDILPKSDTNDILRVVEFLRRTYGGIPTSNIIIDQDGIGVKDFLECHSFFGASAENEVMNETPPHERVGDKYQKRGYRNKRAQLYYLLAEKVNAADVFVDPESFYFHHDALRVERVHTIKLSKIKEVFVKDLIKEDLRTVRKPETIHEKFKELISKEEQKIALGGRSPDFGDMMMMRCQFEFIRKKKYMKSS